MCNLLFFVYFIILSRIVKLYGYCLFRILEWHELFYARRRQEAIGAYDSTRFMPREIE